LLYLQPGGGNLQFGTLVTPLPLPSPNWANQSLDPKLSPAFRVGFAYLPTPSDDVEVDWTHLSSGAKSSFAGSPTQMVGPPFLIGPGADSYKRGQGDASFAYDSVTADGGHTFCAACAFQLQVFAGLEFARIGQNVGGTFESYDGSNTSGYTNSSLFTGIGPRMGTKAQYDVGNFQFAGELAVAALVGRSQGQINFATIPHRRLGHTRAQQSVLDVAKRNASGSRSRGQPKCGLRVSAHRLRTIKARAWLSGGSLFECHKSILADPSRDAPRCWDCRFRRSRPGITG